MCPQHQGADGEEPHRQPGLLHNVVGSDDTPLPAATDLHEIELLPGDRPGKSGGGEDAALFELPGHAGALYCRR